MTTNNETLPAVADEDAETPSDQCALIVAARVKACADRIEKALERASVPVAWRWRRPLKSRMSDWTTTTDPEEIPNLTKIFDGVESEPLYTAPGVPVACPQCDGHGGDADAGDDGGTIHVACAKCGGSGWVTGWVEHHSTQEPCPDCPRTAPGVPTSECPETIAALHREMNRRMVRDSAVFDAVFNVLEKYVNRYSDPDYHEEAVALLAGRHPTQDDAAPLPPASESK